MCWATFVTFFFVRLPQKMSSCDLPDGKWVIFVIFRTIETAFLFAVTYFTDLPG